MTNEKTQLSEPPMQAPTADVSLLHELVDYLRQNRTELREEWVRRITDAQLLRVMTPEEIFSEVCTGMRMTRDWSAMARVTAWRIHHVA